MDDLGDFIVPIVLCGAVVAVLAPLLVVILAFQGARSLNDSPPGREPMKPKRFELTRDSRLLWLGVAAGVIAYLMAAAPLSTWTYYQWLQAAGALITAVSTKLMTSELRGKGEVQRRGRRDR